MSLTSAMISSSPKLALQEPAHGGGAHTGAALPACALAANSQSDITFKNGINTLCNTILIRNNRGGERADKHIRNRSGTILPFFVQPLRDH